MEVAGSRLEGRLDLSSEFDFLEEFHRLHGFQVALLSTRKKSLDLGLPCTSHAVHFLADSLFLKRSLLLFFDLLHGLRECGFWFDLQ